MQHIAERLEAYAGATNAARQAFVALAGLRQVLAKVHEQHGALTAPIFSLHTLKKLHCTMSMRSALKMRRGDTTYVCQFLQRGQHLC